MGNIKSLICIKILFFLLVINWVLPAYSQDLTGHWVGEGTVSRDSDLVNKFETDLIQIGNKVSGISTQITSSKSGKPYKFYLKAEIEGTFDGANLNVRIKRIISYDSESGGFCFTDSEIKYEKKNGREYIYSTSKTNGEYYKNGVIQFNPGCLNSILKSISVKETVDTSLALLWENKKIDKVADIAPFLAPEYIDRTVDVIEETSIQNRKIEIKVRDARQVDGDVVSVAVNDKTILNKYKIKSKPKNVSVQLNYGVNYIVFNADNVGKIPPNTANVEIYADGKRIMEFPIKSDLSSSQAVKIRVE